MITGNLRYILFCCVPSLKRDVLPEQILYKIEQLVDEVRYHPLDVSLNFKIAIDYLRLDNFLAARNQFNEILKKDPTAQRLPQLNLVMGAAELMFGDSEKAIEYFDLQKQGRSSYETYALCAIAFLILNKPKQALEEVNKAIELERRGVNSLALRGLIHETDGQQTTYAIQDYEEVLRNAPTNAIAIERLGVIQEIKHETERMRKLARKQVVPNQNLYLRFKRDDTKG